MGARLGTGRGRVWELGARGVGPVGRIDLFILFSDFTEAVVVVLDSLCLPEVGDDATLRSPGLVRAIIPKALCTERCKIMILICPCCLLFHCCVFVLHFHYKRGLNR